MPLLTNKPHLGLLIILVPLFLVSGVDLFGSAEKQIEDERSRLVTSYQKAEKLKGEGKSSEAATLYQEIIIAAEKLFGSNHPDTLILVNNRGRILENQGLYEEAEGHFRRCVRAIEATSKPEDPLQPLLALFLTNQGDVLRSLGRYSQAESLLRRALAIREKLGAGYETDVGESLSSLAYLYQEKGNPTAAEPLLERCLKIRTEKLPANHPATADTLNILGQLYDQLGQYNRAQTYYEKGLHSREEWFGRNDLEVGGSLNDFGSHYIQRRKYAEAELLLRRALNIADSQGLSKDHPDIAKRCFNLALVCRNRNQLAEAEKLQSRALSIWNKTLQPTHPTLAVGCIGQAAIELAKENANEAISLLKRGLTIREASLGKDHPAVAETISQLCGIWAKLGQWDNVVPALDQSQRILRQHCSRILPALSEKEQLDFLNRQHSPELHGALSLALHRIGDDQIVNKSAGWILNGKGISHEVLALRSLCLRNNPKESTGRLFEDLMGIRKRISSLALLSSSEDSRKLREQLTREENLLVKQLEKLHREENSSDDWVELEDVRNNLSKDSVLIEICRLPIWDFEANSLEKVWNDPHYCAWIIPSRNQGSVRIIDLGPSGKIDELIRRVRQSLQIKTIANTNQERQQQETLARGELRALAQLILEPLEKYAGQTSQWIISPDANLWIVPWAALPLIDERYAVEKYQISYEISGRYLVKKNRTHSTRPSLVLADPDFDSSSTDQTGKPSSREQDRIRVNTTTSFLTNVQWNRLPGTAIEAKAVAGTIQQFTHQEPLLFMGNQASESRFRKADKPEFLVLSTHGFFLDERFLESFDEEEDRRGFKLKMNPGTVDPRSIQVDFNKSIENPLLRCGLILAGANHRDAVESIDQDNGILTGLKIIDTDLRGTSLVVLSACETGLGQVRTGEGVVGLRQAFQLAGAKSVVASLWKIPDKETTDLMILFWQELVAGKNKAKALQNAQLMIIKKHRDQFGAAHPFFWAAFGLTGQ